MTTTKVISISESETNDKHKILYQLLSSDLSFDEKRSDVNPRHYWHSFPAKFPPGLPRTFITKLTKENDVVLDPMAGSCTTLVESELLGRQSFGFDIDPLSLTIGRAKLSNIDLQLLRIEGFKLLERAKKNYADDKKTLKVELEKRFDRETLEFLDYWFLKNSQLELLSLVIQIEKQKNETHIAFFRMILSGTIITKSGGVTLGLDLAHTRPHKVKEKEPNSAFIDFHKRLLKITSSPISGESFNSKMVLQEANAKHLPLPPNSVDLIVTSPPYANNAIDYMRAHKFSLVWFGYKISELKEIRKTYVGSENFVKEYIMELPLYVKNIISKLSAIDGSKGRALHRYYSEMKSVIHEYYRVLKPNSTCVIVVATSILKGIDVETQICLSKIGELAGFELVGIGERTINRNKRMLPTSHIKSNSQIESRMHNEYVIGLLKK